ncbi:uncharacterized protein [Macrobrachium rosenbergii]|uniref:uncharacterized protein n=1 Tax=Macrobrachium rosenbergii TaxID=79674 RepID=UPI0034D5E8F3
MQDAYFHVPIHPDLRKYLRFVFQDRVFQFRALCFRLSTAPQVFTCILAPHEGRLHLMGIIALYLDDWLLCSPAKEQCTEDLHKTLLLAQDLGLLIILQKSQLAPSQEIVYLESGILSTGSRQVFHSPNLLCQQMDESPRNSGSHRTVHVLGKITHESSSILPQSQLGQEKSPRLIHFPVTHEIKKHLLWWRSKDRLLEGESPLIQNPDLNFYAGASDIGWGALMGDKRSFT